MDPIMLVMFGLMAVLIFFMFRNGRKRQQAQLEMQNNMRPGAEVMLQSGIYATVEEVDEEQNRVTVRSGDSTLVVHRNAIGQIIAPVVGIDDESAHDELAPDDDPEFGERIGELQSDSQPEASDEVVTGVDEAETNDKDQPKA